MEEKAIALRVLIEVAKSQPDKAPALWQAARILLNAPLVRKQSDIAKTESNNQENKPEFLPLRAEFDYADENGLHSHRTVWVMSFTDGRDIKRNKAVPVADRYGYLLTGYCTLRQQIRSFRSSRISNFRTFTEGSSLEPNRQWRPRTEQMAG